MDVLAPSPGTAAPGNLYVDLQTRTLWLGVDPTVEPEGSVLISDMLGMQAEIDGALVEAKAYTDAALLTRAPLSHTHPSAQITDFAAAVQAVVNDMPALSFTQKMIMMYSGSIADVGVGPLAGWQLCDGSNGSPDLRDKFVLGAGNKPVGEGNSQTKVVVSTAGSHVHVVAGTAISQAQMPVHAHAVSASGSGSGSTDAAGAHAHNYLSGTFTLSQSNLGDRGGPAQNRVTDVQGNHAHNVNVSVNVTGATDNRGSGQAHTHDMAYAGDHSHEFSSNALREAAPYFTLAFIMKL